MTDATHDRHTTSATHRAGASLRLALGLVLVAAIVAFAFDNRDNVRIGWVVGDADAPLVLVLLATAVVGAIVGWLLVHRPSHHGQ